MNSNTFKPKGTCGRMVAGLAVLAAAIIISPGKGLGKEPVRREDWPRVLLNAARQRGIHAR